MPPVRMPWERGFPDVVIHTTVRERDAHPDYAAAKAGDADAAWRLARDLLTDAGTQELRALGRNVANAPVLLPITALETTGFNAIPDAMANVLSDKLGWPRSAGEIVQSNTVGHTRAKSFNRLVTPASFEGHGQADVEFVLVDDHVGLGGTLANLKGHIEAAGGRVVGMTTLTESRDGRRIALTETTRNLLWDRHGSALDILWRERIGHGLDGLTELEAQILGREPSVDAIADRMAQAAVEARGRGLETVVRGGEGGLIV